MLTKNLKLSIISEKGSDTRMNITEYTNYMLNKYNQEILETYLDQKGTKKNRIKNEEKINELKETTKKLFKFDNLTTTLKIGPAYNCSEKPWIHIHDENNKKGTKGEYIGISFNKEKQTLELWFGFGSTNMKKKERQITKQNYQTKLKAIEPILKQNFAYQSLFVEATIISKEILLSELNEEKLLEDLIYLTTLYRLYEAQYRNSSTTASNIENIPKLEETYQLPTSKYIEGINILYIGSSGTGKTYTIKQKYIDNINPIQYEMIMLNKEYTNSKLIGEILPITKSNITNYQFIPGPFTRLLKKAIHNPQTNFYLIIEEINQNNLMDILGDITLLLERKNGNGRSIYEINSPLLAKEIYNNETAKIYLPENFSIIATYDPSQENNLLSNTFFKRRWISIYIQDKTYPIDYLYLKGFNTLTWGKFRNTINKIMKSLPYLKNRKLGAFLINSSFVSTEPTFEKEERLNFTNQVLIHLFEILNKEDKNIIFNEQINDIDDLLKEISKYNFETTFNTNLIKQFGYKNNTSNQEERSK